MACRSSSSLGAVLLGAAAGFAAGILLAPKSGKETRRDVKRQADAYKQQADHGIKVARQAAETGRQELKTVADEVVQDARELSADAKVRAKRTGEHAKTSARNVSEHARTAWSGQPHSDDNR